MFKWFKSREEKEKEELRKLDDDYYDPDADGVDEDWTEEDQEELEWEEEQYGDDGPEEPEPYEMVCYEGDRSESYSHACRSCGFPIAWTEDGDAVCRSCDARYDRPWIFNEMNYRPPFKKCLRCNQPYPHCLSWCESLSYEEREKRGYDD